MSSSKHQIDFLIIDAHALAYKAYYALLQQNFKDSEGRPTGAVYGFFRMLFKILNEYKPKKIAITWDPPDKTFRHSLYKDYKANRKPMPEDLIYQIEVIKEFLKEIGFPIILSPINEADDIMGTLVEKFKKNYKIILLTGDKDCYQLLDKNVIMLRGKKGVSEFQEITESFVVKELGILPEQVPDYLGIVGDSSDNIPGVKGIGPINAKELLKTYKTLENIYESLEKINPKLKEKLLKSKEEAFLSKKLATIKKDVKEILSISEDVLNVPNYLDPEVLFLFRKKGFQQIYKDLLKEFGRQEENLELFSKEIEPFRKYNEKIANYKLITTEEGLKECIEELQKESEIVIDTETSSLNVFEAKLVGVSLCSKKNYAYYISISNPNSQFAKKGISIDVFKRYFEKLNTLDKKFIGQNIKFDYKILKKFNIEIKNLYFDTMIASYILNPGIRQHNLDDLAMEYLGYKTIKYEEVVGDGKKQKTFDQIDPENVYIYSCEDADITYQLYLILKEKLEEKNLLKNLHTLECPLVKVLSEMELNGVKIDLKYFEKLSIEYDKRIHQLVKNIYQEAGGEFNINSTKELQFLLFEKIRLPIQKKTKTGYSTDQNVLESLRGLHPIVESLLEYRKLMKLKNTYIDVLPRLVEPSTGRIHTSFSQTITSTGRLSSNSPNLQNIPIKDEEGRAIRKGFIAEKGYKLISVDYSQIELRILAHYSKDEKLINAFLQDEDIHTNTAVNLFQVPKEKVTLEMRNKAKIVNFSIIYGATPYGLSLNLGIEPKEAKEYIERFLTTFQGVKHYIDSIISFAEKNGYVETISGRRRYIPDIKSTNKNIRESAQRIAINTPIQGTSADIIKKAMIDIYKEIQSKNLKTKMILQVHDELIFEAPIEEIELMIHIARERMENAIPLSVPLKVDVGIGKNWAEVY